MSYEKNARTEFAFKAMELSSMFMVKFGRRVLEGEIQRSVKVDEPEESTGGGKHAREPITLVPVGEEVGGIVIGWMDVAQQKAEIRSYQVLEAIHKNRTGVDLDLDRLDYENFIDEMKDFFGRESIVADVNMRVPALKSAEKTSSAALQAGTGSPVFWVLSAIILMSIGLVLGFVFFGK